MHCALCISQRAQVYYLKNFLNNDVRESQKITEGILKGGASTHLRFTIFICQFHFKNTSSIIIKELGSTITIQMSTSLPPPVNSINKNSSSSTSSIASSNSTYFINLYKKSKILTIIFTSFVLLILLNLINGNNGDGSHSYNSINNGLLHKQFSPLHEPSECDNPFSMLGKLQVDLNVKEENVWIPFNKKCQPPRLMASLSNELGVQSPTNWSPLTSSTTLNKNFEDVSFTFNKTVLVVGDSIARESVKYFCQLLNQDVVNLNDDHPWSPFRNYENENENTHRKRAPRESSLPNICYIPQIDLMIIQMFHFGLDEEEFFKEKEQYNPPGKFILIALEDFFFIQFNIFRFREIS